MQNETKERLTGLKLGDVVRVRDNETLLAEDAEGKVASGWTDQMKFLCGKEIVMDKLAMEFWNNGEDVICIVKDENVPDIAELFALMTGDISPLYLIISPDMVEMTGESADEDYDMEHNWNQLFPEWLADLHIGSTVKLRDFTEMEVAHEEGNLSNIWKREQSENFADYQDKEFEFTELDLITAHGFYHKPQFFSQFGKKFDYPRVTGNLVSYKISTDMIQLV